MDAHELSHYQKVQDAARLTLNNILPFIQPGLNERDLVKICDSMQRDAGIDTYWYKNLQALVLVGSRTELSISNQAYVPSTTRIQKNDIVTIDLNPSINGYCGDYARTFYIEDGIARCAPEVNQASIAGAAAQAHLHALLFKVAHSAMTFNSLYQIMHHAIDQLGFEQLDYIGHNILPNMRQMQFIAPNVSLTLGEAQLFTLEPQIRPKGGNYAFKHENIYYFQDDLLHML